MTNLINIINYTLALKPKAVQRYWIEKVKRFNIIICCRQVGKTTYFIWCFYTTLIFSRVRNPVGFATSLTDKQVLRNIYLPLLDMLRFIPEKYVHGIKSELTIIIQRPWCKDYVSIYMFGCENPDSIRGGSPNALLIDEAAFIKKKTVFKSLIPLLTATKGTLFMISTLNGRGWYWCCALYWALLAKLGDKQYMVHEVDIYSCKDYTDSDIQTIKQSMSKEAFALEYLNDPDGRVSGLIYNSEYDYIKNNNLGDYSLNPSYPVFGSWDLGVGEKLIVWVGQYIAGHYVWLDVFKGADGEGATQMIVRLKNSGYKFSAMLLPHDGNTLSKFSGQTHAELIKSQFPGIQIKTAPKPATKSTRIEASRPFLYRMKFDKSKCGYSLRFMSRYFWKLDTKTGSYLPEPEGSLASDYIDALTVCGGFGVGGIEKFAFINNGMYDKPKRKLIKRPSRLGSFIS